MIFEVKTVPKTTRGLCPLLNAPSCCVHLCFKWGGTCQSREIHSELCHSVVFWNVRCVVKIFKVCRLGNLWRACKAKAPGRASTVSCGWLIAAGFDTKTVELNRMIPRSMSIRPVSYVAQPRAEYLERSSSHPRMGNVSGKIILHWSRHSFQSNEGITTGVHTVNSTYCLLPCFLAVAIVHSMVLEVCQEKTIRKSHCASQHLASSGKYLVATLGYVCMCVLVCLPF